MVAMINTDAYLFLSKETKRENIKQEASPSEVKNTAIDLGFTHGSVFIQLFPMAWIFPKPLSLIFTNDKLKDKSKHAFLVLPHIITSMK